MKKIINSFGKVISLNFIKKEKKRFRTFPILMAFPILFIFSIILALLLGPQIGNSFFGFPSYAESFIFFLFELVLFSAFLDGLFFASSILWDKYMGRFLLLLFLLLLGIYYLIFLEFFKIPFIISGLIMFVGFFLVYIKRQKKFEREFKESQSKLLEEFLKKKKQDSFEIKQEQVEKEKLIAVYSDFLKEHYIDDADYLPVIIDGFEDLLALRDEENSERISFYLSRFNSVPIELQPLFIYLVASKFVALQEEGYTLEDFYSNMIK